MVRHVWVWLLSLGLLLGLLSVPAWAESVPEVKILLEDRADLYTEQEEQKLLELMRALAQKTKWHVMLLSSQDAAAVAEKEADDAYDQNIGINTDGICLLLNIATRDYYLSSSGAAIGVLDDATINKLMDEAGEALGAGDFALAMQQTLAGVQRAFDEAQPQPNSLGVTDALIALGGAGAVAARKNVRTKRSYRTKSQIPAYALFSQLKGSQVQTDDQFLKKDVSRVYVEPPQRASSSGGGSSTHVSSGGGVHGGGGRKF